MDIGTSIRKIRELKGFSQEYMANQLEISQRQFSRIEKNDTDLSLSKLTKISELLEVTPTQIMGFDEKFIFQNCQAPSAITTNQNYYAFSDKEREQYEKRILQLENELIFLRNQFETVLNRT